MVEMYQRPELYKFSNEMESVLRKHDRNKKDTWRTKEIEFLHNKLVEEVTEYFESRDISELIDIANICMMLWCRRR